MLKKQRTWFKNEPIDLEMMYQIMLVISEIVSEIISNYNN